MLPKSAENTLLKIMLVLTIVGAGVLLFVVRTGAAPPTPPDPSQGNPQILVELAALREQLAAHDTAMAEEHLEDHLRDPFDVSVEVCGEIGTEAGLEAKLGVEGTVGIEGEKGVKIYGNGATNKLGAESALGLEGAIAGKGGLALSVCLNGVDVRQNGPLTAEEQLIVAEFEDGATGASNAIRTLIETLGVTVGNVETALGQVRTMSVSSDPSAAMGGLDNGAGFGGLLDTLPLNSATRVLLGDAENLVPNALSSLTAKLCDTPELDTVFADICGLSLAGPLAQGLLEQAILDQLLQGFSGDLGALRTELRSYTRAVSAALCSRTNAVFNNIADTDVLPGTPQYFPFIILSNPLNCDFNAV